MALNAADCPKTIFISWSGEYTKEFAEELKKSLHEDIFFDCRSSEIKWFVSTEDIRAGDQWRDSLKNALQSCELGIVCITKENVLAPWLYFEAGAMEQNNIPIIPLLLNCDGSILDKTPFSKYQFLDFHKTKDFRKLISRVNEEMGFDLDERVVERRSSIVYRRLREKLAELFQDLKDLRTFNTKYVYPNNVDYIKRNTVYISAPISSVQTDREFTELKEAVKSIRDELARIAFDDIWAPILDVDPKKRGKGELKAVKENFQMMKKAECMLMIYPWSNASGTLVEVGYGISLCKKTVIFHRESLPYLLKGASKSNTVSHVKEFSFSDYSDIAEIIEDEGMNLFD